MVFVFLCFTDSTKIETLPSHDKNNAVSDDSDDEEWNYIKGEAKAANSETNNLEKSPCSEVSVFSLSGQQNGVSFSFRKLHTRR